MIVAITQRYGYEHGGISALELTYISFFASKNITLLPIPNNPKHAKVLLQSIKVDGIILSGGGDIGKAMDAEFARDDTEKSVLDFAIKNNIPVLGICRGMEAINVYFGGKIQNANSITDSIEHDDTSHNIKITSKTISSQLKTDTVRVNSYHRMVITNTDLSTELTAFAIAPDNTIEAFYHSKYQIAGIIWHPEREESSHALNDLLISAFSTNKLFWGKQNE